MTKEDYNARFEKLEQELVQLCSEKCETESDILRQEARLDEINAEINQIGDELRQERKKLDEKKLALQERREYVIPTRILSSTKDLSIMRKFWGNIFIAVLTIMCEY